MDRFDAMQIFVRVVEKGSFSAVAKERGIGQPAVSNFPRMPAVEYAPSINMSNWLLSTSG